jgi:amidase
MSQRDPRDPCLGVPAGVVPVGLVEGLPAGIQIVSRRFREDLILDAMTVVEREVGVMARTLWARRTTPVWVS